MSYPDRLKIGDRYYRIRFVKSIRGCKKSVDKKNTVLGLCDEGRAEILIRNELSTDEKLKTLLHELGHAMEFEYNINMPHAAIYKYEEALFDFICANIDVFKK